MRGRSIPAQYALTRQRASHGSEPGVSWIGAITPEDQEPDRRVLIEGAGIGGEGGRLVGGEVWDMEYAARPCCHRDHLASSVPGRVEASPSRRLRLTPERSSLWPHGPWCSGPMTGPAPSIARHPPRASGT
jgi:hypothetical protein